MSDAYEIVYFRGARLDRITAQALSKMEDRLGYDLTIVQGSYNAGGVSASAGTHDGGGAVDLAPADHVRKIRVAREIGFAIWYRPTIPGLWNAHIHGILIGNTRASSGALNQVSAYRNGRNGLADNGPDNFGWRPSPIPSYKFVPDKLFGVTLHGLRVDFLNALAGRTNKARRRGRIVQRLLNKKAGANLAVDGVIGPVTVEAWRKWERKIGTEGRHGVPDRKTLRELFRRTVYYIKSE